MTFIVDEPAPVTDAVERVAATLEGRNRRGPGLSSRSSWTASWTASWRLRRVGRAERGLAIQNALNAAEIAQALAQVETLRFQLDQALARARAVRVADVDARSLPETHPLEEIAHYEAHVEDCLARTTRTLRREQARRLLRQAFHRLGQHETGFTES